MSKPSIRNKLAFFLREAFSVKSLKIDVARLMKHKKEDPFIFWPMAFWAVLLFLCWATMAVFYIIQAVSLAK